MGICLILLSLGVGTMSIFKQYKDRFILEPKSAPGLRKCQLGAIWALKSYFISNTPEVAALVSMPTGAGKTAIMMAACFELNLSKILIIEPSKVLRNQIAEQFRNLKILKDIGCVPNDFPEVNVCEIRHIQSKKNWGYILQNNDVIVAHPNCISPYYPGVSPLPAELIDAVFMDEAHHEPAPTWKEINRFYSSIKRIFLTATPFRRDKKNMEAKLVYHYSLKQAFDDGILRPINFEGVEAGVNEEASDLILVATAKKRFENEKKKNPVSLFIRTDRINHAEKLLKLYNSTGLRVGLIHSNKKDKDNQCVINEVKSGKLDGLISVGMASEGLDIPLLKIAVLHRTPKSLPYTIQFLGRITRQPMEQVGNAILIANVDEVKGEVNRLYKSDVTWAKLVPDLIDKELKRATYNRTALIDAEDFVLPDLNLYFSTIVYDVPKDFSLNQDFRVNNSSPYRIISTSQESINHPLVIITAVDKPIEWANKEICIENYLDIHVFYHIQEKRLLFEFTTSEEALNSFSKSLYNGKVKNIPYSKLYKVFSEFKQESYLMVGMKNAIMPSSFHPSYKTFIGNNVQNAIRDSEGRIFGVGHALMKKSEKDTWGLSTKKCRIWAMRRGNLDEYQAWCDELANLLTSNTECSTLPGLSFLASTSPINKLEEMPLVIIINDVFFKTNLIQIDIQGNREYKNVVPNILAKSFDKATGDLICTFSVESFSCQLTMNFSKAPLWSVQSEKDVNVSLLLNGDFVKKDLESLLNELPPTLIMPKGYIIEGRTQITPNTSMESLSKEIWVKKAWGDNCTLTSEKYNPSPKNRVPVTNRVVDFIEENFDSKSDVLILDDGAHEIADLIWIQGSALTINFFHVKPSTKPKPGCRKSDCDVVLAQAMRSVHWVFSATLFDRLKERLGKKSKVILGCEQQVYNLAKAYESGIRKWRFKIVVAQPGFDIKQVSDRTRKNNNVYELIIPTYDRITTGPADFEIWGS